MTVTVKTWAEEDTSFVWEQRLEYAVNEQQENRGTQNPFRISFFSTGPHR